MATNPYGDTEEWCVAIRNTPLRLAFHTYVKRAGTSTTWPSSVKEKV
jgi:hypothetical protein